MSYRFANLIITSSVMGCLAVVAVALRLWARKVGRMKRGADDALIIVGLVLALGLCICNIVGAAQFRWGDHELYVDSGPLEGWPVDWLLLRYGKIFYSIQLLHATAMPVIKASLMIFLRRIFGHVKAFRQTFWVVGVYVFLWWLTTFWMSVFQCWPISSTWGTSPGQIEDCIPNFLIWYSWVALLNVVSDVAIIIIPIPLVWRLQMPLRQRLVTISILTTAIIVIIAGIGRTVGYFTVDHDSLELSRRYHASTSIPDVVSKSSLLLLLDKFSDVLIWTSIEPCLGVVGCCIPTLGPLVDLKHSALHFKIKSIFSWQPLLGKSASEISSNRSGQRTVLVELTSEKHSQSEPRVGYEATVDAGSVGDGLHTAHKSVLVSAHQQV